MGNELYQCNWCGVRIRNGIDITLHVMTTHYHIDGAVKPKESKRIIRKTIPYYVTSESLAERIYANGN